VTRNLIKNGLIAAGLMNITGVLIFSRAFTNAAINAAAITSSIKWLAAAFAVEKLVYVAMWISWHSSNSLTQLYAEDLFAGVFYSIYGLNDFVFMLFFVWVFFRQVRSE
jgi:uncharacterized membrane protein YjfL (UPF0719 family)